MTFTTFGNPITVRSVFGSLAYRPPGVLLAADQQANSASSTLHTPDEPSLEHPSLPILANVSKEISIFRTRVDDEWFVSGAVGVVFAPL